ncbi:MAG: mandelate racemase/muconate lactonizing enzyme family protein [Proteobacteria bacterium]|nr:mandelate racemase/muconate lactonizing enzyme family protein [Pseudomonadota bacterium]MBI3496949.1 mandelate racemase/muconate lactonizing enzyme family protein [Pseudomonadota bacterium]
MPTRIEAVDLFYVSMPVVEDISDGSQDALLVRVAAGGKVGWGECEASPLTSIASWVAPMSHGFCHPLRASVLGERLDSIADIQRINALVKRRSLDILQTDHTLSGIDEALWDLLGKRRGEPVWKLLGYRKSWPKTPYASQLFGNTPQQTLRKARKVRKAGYRATKFGWGRFGTGTVKQDADHLMAAREGLGPDGILLVDAGCVFADDVKAAARRLAALSRARATWYEEPMDRHAFAEYKALSRLARGGVKLAGGEGAYTFHMAKQMIDFAGIGFVQIDAGRIGGITPAKAVADYAKAKGVTFVNHTFTSHLQLTASLQPYAGLREHELCEYPVELKPVAWAITKNHLLLDRNGQVAAPDAPGLGVEIDVRRLRPYLVDVMMSIGGKLLYKTPRLRA